MVVASVVGQVVPRGASRIQGDSGSVFDGQDHTELDLQRRATAEEQAGGKVGGWQVRSTEGKERKERARGREVSVRS